MPRMRGRPGERQVDAEHKQRVAARVTMFGLLRVHFPWLGIWVSIGLVSGLA